ncbi:mucin-19-like [Limanda limanda]|uniref:mucin-19-like n=1 Tax=Limanda limanda TaxID=27771 RepID=UPI0029C8B9E5|nr:mucin-19-like [Limanda limanda]
MTPHRWTLAFCFSLVSDVCKTLGSGVMQPFNGSGFHVRSNCPFTLTRFTHNRVEYDITTRRGNSGLLTQLEITVNKVRTIVQGGSIEVEKKSIALPYDHTYQHIFQYGTYIKLRSSLLPLSVTWHNVSGGIDFVELELEKELNIDMTGLCGKLNVPSNKQQLIAASVLTEDTCQTRDPVSAVNMPCREFFSHTLDCLQVGIPQYIELCEENIYSFESSKDISCAFFKEVVQECGNNSYIWNKWRRVTGCAQPSCPGDLVFVEQGPAFVPSCSNPNPRFSNQDLTSSCVCPEGTVVNDQAEGIHCVKESDCPCVFAGRSYSTGHIRSTKCQSCVCEGGKWHCSENSCPARCLMEGQFVTTFDGKQYVVPGKCTYVVSQGHNWKIIVQFSTQRVSLQTAVLQLFQDMYTFSYNSVKLGEKEITELHQSDHALVFWQSSMYIQVQTSFGMNIQVQMSPEIQLYITLPQNHTDVISGLCGNSNNDTTDDFTTSSGIIENSPQAFALSWSAGICVVNIPPICSSTDSEIFADEGCSVLNEATGIFATCHIHIPTDNFHTACIQRTCNCGNNLQQCLCVALGSYAKACASLGVAVGDWRKATNCTLNCQRNQEFSYDVRACNHTCRLLSGPDPRCWLDDAPLEGCGCPEGTHLNQGQVCTPKGECVCHHYGGTTPPGPVVIDGRQCLCENGELHCSKDCGCRNGKVCVHCSEYLVNTAQKTCDSLSKPLGSSLTCESGCHCPHDQYEDHHGNCVSLDNCTCVYSGKMFSAGQHVKTNCKTCVCGQGQWHCKDEPCTRKCQVYGNGHYQTFDSKWYRFNGHCQYTLVEDYCGNQNGSFSVRVESVPCCDEALTCSRSIVLDLQGTVTLTLSDMRVTRRLQKGWTLQEDSFYTTHTVGLYIVISVPSRGITLIWDKHTRITVELHPYWRNRVCGLCGNFDSSEMNDLQISGSAVVSSPMAFGNNWKATSPPCSDVTTEIFPCERNSYCSAWAQRRCMIITADTFKDCHLKVDPEPYYHACVQESCSCEFEGKFLGFCTAVAAYAEACSEQDVCVKWRTPDLCPVYCDYYNEQGQCSWHYEACGEVLTCGKGHYFTDKLEGCYPRCPKDAQFYDENTGECTKLRNCTCFFNDTIIQPGAVVMLESIKCSFAHNNITHHLYLKHSNYNFFNHKGNMDTYVINNPYTNYSHLNTHDSHYQFVVTTSSACIDCTDLKRNKTWACGETWTEDCFHSTCHNGKIELTPVVCPEPTSPICPRGQVTKVSDGCCETWKCDCRCELYGDPHYISFAGVTFDFLDECTYILVEEQSPQHLLSIAVDNFYCVPGLHGSCAKGIILKYQDNVATLSKVPEMNAVKATLNNVTIQPPYEEQGLRFETTGYAVSIYLPEVRSYVSLSPSYTLVVNLAMEHFLNNTQGQCGVCGGGSCIRRGGQIEDNNCCDKTAYDWVFADPLNSACVSQPRDVTCLDGPPPVPPTRGPPSPPCDLLDHPVFQNCRTYVNLQLKKKNCEFDSCGSKSSPCSSLEQAAEECKKAGICINWRELTNGTCDVQCPEGLVYRECHDKLDDFCYGGVRYTGASLEKNTIGCFCPSSLFRAGNHSNNCVSDCRYCKGPLGEPRLPGEVWQSNCHQCSCNNQTWTEECFPKLPLLAPRCYNCGPEKNCSYNEKTYKVGDTWKDAAHPCMSFSCSIEGIQTERRNCPKENCSEGDRVWDDQHCCFTCNQICAPKLSSFNITIENCTTIIEMPVCQGLCVSQPRVVLHSDLQVEHNSRCCLEQSAERRSLTLQCLGLTTRRYHYKHITSCECRACSVVY